mmetsp:Transcript_29326/g.77043  ORF Transcript_29326/g.77043 Transcript_29326/m.77043 type:complete len:158 (+) Transcript_29326:766-1239(+)
MITLVAVMEKQSSNINLSRTQFIALHRCHNCTVKVSGGKQCLSLFAVCSANIEAIFCQNRILSTIVSHERVLGALHDGIRDIWKPSTQYLEGVPRERELGFCFPYLHTFLARPHFVCMKVRSCSGLENEATIQPTRCSITWLSAYTRILHHSAGGFS